MGMEGGGNFLILLSDSALIGLNETVDFPFFYGFLKFNTIFLVSPFYKSPFREIHLRSYTYSPF